MRLPAALRRRLEASAHDLIQGEARFDFAQPPGEPALTAPDSVSWRVFKNPLSLFIGGVAAVILELAEPRVRSGVWDHTTFRTDPVRRLRRTGLAAMVTVYGPRSGAEAMIAGIVRAHERVQGVTPAGEPYRASDPALLDWVHATAQFGFLQAYHRYVRPLPRQDRDRFYAEGAEAAALYGATSPPGSEAGWAAMLEAMRGKLEPSDIVFEFLAIMRRAEVLPPALRPLQGLLIAAAVELTPGWVRGTLGLDRRFGLPPWAGPVLRAAGRAADTIALRTAPPAQACLRLGLPADHLYR